MSKECERCGFPDARAMHTCRPKKERVSDRADKLVSWQPISTAPKGEKVLCYELGDYYAAELCDYGWSPFCGQHVTETPEPTHWMALPKPPND